MPYLKSYSRTFLSHIVAQIIMTTISEPGELNYLFTMIIKRYISCCGERYRTYNDVLGALEACKLELYARKVRPYEDKKIEENGDVW